MSDLVGNPKDRFSYVAAHIITVPVTYVNAKNKTAYPTYITDCTVPASLHLGITLIAVIHKTFLALVM